MKTVTASLDLDEILRERLDASATYKRNIKIPSELLADWESGKELSEEEDKKIHDYIFSKLLKIFLDAKGTLIIPDDAAHKFIAENVNNFGGTQIRFAYQDFYAYQFIDNLQDIVRRASKVRDVFAKKSVPEPVKRICKEAYLTFIYGYHTASIALCRSIVEAVLKNRLNIDIGELCRLNDIGLGQKLYPQKIWYKIDQIRKDGNKFIHAIDRDKNPSESDNLKILGYTQEVLQVLTY